MLLSFLSSSESRPGSGAIDHQLRSRTSDRFYKTISQSWNNNSLQSAQEGEAWIIFIPESLGHRDLAVRDRGLPTGQLHHIHPGAVQPLRVVQPPPLQP